VLVYTPERFGLMRVGDFLDAMTGYNEAEIERVKSLAELMRIQTGLLWNVQVGVDDKMDANKLWPLPWDKDGTGHRAQGTEQEQEEVKKFEERQSGILNKM
jgi:hypothetical protein